MLSLLLENVGYTVRHVATLENIEATNQRYVPHGPGESCRLVCTAMTLYRLRTVEVTG